MLLAMLPSASPPCALVGFELATRLPRSRRTGSHLSGLGGEGRGAYEPGPARALIPRTGGAETSRCQAEAPGPSGGAATSFFPFNVCLFVLNVYLSSPRSLWREGSGSTRRAGARFGEP